MSKKALIIVDHGSKFEEANLMLEQVAALLENKNTDYHIIAHCHMELAEPTIEQAFESCVSQGATDIVVHPYFLAPGRHSTQDIPNMVRKAAANYPQVSYVVTDPLGIHDKIIDVILERASSNK